MFIRPYSKVVKFLINYCVNVKTLIILSSTRIYLYCQSSEPIYTKSNRQHAALVRMYMTKKVRYTAHEEVAYIFVAPSMGGWIIVELSSCDLVT